MSNYHTLREASLPLFEDKLTSGRSRRAIPPRSCLLLIVPTVFLIGCIKILRYDLPLPISLHTSSVRMKGGTWDAQVYNTIRPVCPKGRPEAISYAAKYMPVTALASFPRSGNSYARSLIERASGYQTSSLYCDWRLRPAFPAECDGLDSPFLVKTHWPSSRDINETEHWQHFERALHVVRNPFDMAWSNYQMDHTHTHTQRVKGLEKFDRSHRKNLERYAREWIAHAQYWERKAKLQLFTVRYEDLGMHTLSTIMRIMTFLLPAQDLPSMEQVTCALEQDPSKDPYRSRKSPVFDAWDRFDEETRLWFLDLVKEPWCTFGYDVLFRQLKGLDSPVDCKNLSPKTRRS